VFYRLSFSNASEVFNMSDQPKSKIAPRLNHELVQYHKVTLRNQIDSLRAQIESNLTNKKSIKYLKQLILERELYLNAHPGNDEIPTQGTRLQAKRFQESGHFPIERKV
jgi:hypothetical protein